MTKPKRHPGPRRLRWVKKRDVIGDYWRAGWGAYIVSVSKRNGMYLPNCGRMAWKPMKSLEKAKLHAVKGLNRHLRREVERHLEMIDALETEIFGDIG